MLPISGLPLNTYYLRVCWSNEQQYDGLREVRDYRHFKQKKMVEEEEMEMKKQLDDDRSMMNV